MAHSPRGGAHVLTLSPFNCFLCWALNLGVGASISGWQGLVFCLGHLIAVPPPPAPSLPSQYGEAHLHSCEPVVWKAEMRVWSVLRQWNLRPLPVAAPCCTTHGTPGPPPPLTTPVPSGCLALCCLQHHSNLSVCPLLGLGSQEAWRVWGRAVL